MCVCVCVYTYIYIYVYACIYIYIHIHVYIIYIIYIYIYMGRVADLVRPRHTWLLVYIHIIFTHTHGPGGAAGDIAAGVYGRVSRAEVAASSVGVERDRGAARRAVIGTHTHTRMSTLDI